MSHSGSGQNLPARRFQLLQLLRRLGLDVAADERSPARLRPASAVPEFGITAPGPAAPGLGNNLSAPRPAATGPEANPAGLRNGRSVLENGPAELRNGAAVPKDSATAPPHGEELFVSNNLVIRQLHAGLKNSKKVLGKGRLAVLQKHHSRKVNH